MAITDAEILRVRRMTAELDAKGSYPDNVIRAMAEDYSSLESRYPAEDVTVYDLHAIAAEIWGEKAAELSEKAYDFTENGVGDYRRSQKYQNAIKMRDAHLAQRKTRSRRPTKAPREAEADVTL